MSPSVTVPLSGSCKVASVRIRLDLPAPFGPSSPYIPDEMVRETLSERLNAIWVCFREVLNSKFYAFVLALNFYEPGSYEATFKNQEVNA